MKNDSGCGCTGSSCSTGPLPRREFIKLAGLGAATLGANQLLAVAGPFTREDFDHLVPVDKKLAPDWVKALFARGEPEILRGSELKYVGMPVGGIGAGQVYLGGDGQLWYWDTFDRNVKTDEGHYAHPQLPFSTVQQGFALRIKSSNHAQTRKLQAGDWTDITFRGEYPVGRVEYADPTTPVSVRLEAFSPFIPLNTDDSSLPATILEFTLKNSGAEKIEVELRGWLESAVGLISARSTSGERKNQIVRHGNLLKLDCAATETTPGEKPFAQEADFGTMTLALLSSSKGDCANPSGTLENIFGEVVPSESAAVPLDQNLIGMLGRKLELEPGGSAQMSFVLAWHFPNLSLPQLGLVGRHYATRFDSASAVADYVAENVSRLAGQTKLWRDTWYDSTLPFWFLDRTFLNTSTLASSTCYRFANGRFYGWEGVGCCAGTCGHVYQYAHAAARLFPELERDARERVDFGLAIQPNGEIYFRAEVYQQSAVDGQAGTILRALREHQMSVNGTFLNRNWTKIKLAMQWLIAKDADNDGLIESNQHNTLDSDWFGKVAWLSGLYLAALLAAAEMADEVGDQDFARQCRGIQEVGRKNLVAQLFDGDYFINEEDPKHLDAINSGTGCLIDQVFGQSWAFQVGLPRVLPKTETTTALKSLWRYNFTPDVGPYRDVYKSGRWYAMSGEAGLLMCTFPRRDWDSKKASGNGEHGYASYFNECMNGFEYQAAGHMIWEGLVLEGLAVARAVHDRYHATRRNPWNEVECGDHYARSMASYGVYLAACGFEYYGPKQHIGFAPKLSPEKFSCAFTSAEGWGSFAQTSEGGNLRAEITVRFGQLELETIALECAEGNAVHVSLGSEIWPANWTREGKRLTITLNQPAIITAGEKLQISVA